MYVCAGIEGGLSVNEGGKAPTCGGWKIIGCNDICMTHKK